MIREKKIYKNELYSDKTSIYFDISSHIALNTRSFCDEMGLHHHPNLLVEFMYEYIASYFS